MKWSEGLEGEAPREIARTDESPLRVLAGPGTGKTFALMRRLTRLLEEGVNPERILLCTFARTAARDLREEVEAMGIPGAEDIHASTLHSYCFGVLGKNAILPLTGRTPRTLSEFENRFLLEDLKSENFEGYYDCKDRLLAFEAAWARLQKDDPGWAQEPLDVAFEEELESWLRFHEAMLIEELVPVTLRYLRNNPACPERTDFDYVLVDEYQDLNRAEQEVIELLAEGSSLTIVGDQDQSIYSFKHAHPEGISEFSERRPGTHDVSLETCRRCPDRVVELANRLIGQNNGRMPRELNPHDENPEGEIHVVQWPGLDEEAKGLAQFVHGRIEEGHVDPGKVLVLVPRKQFGQSVHAELERFGTSSYSFFQSQPLDGRPQKLDRSEAQQAMCLLKLATEPDDVVALRCWCGFGSPTLRTSAWERVRNHCEKENIAARDALQQMSDGTLKISYTHHVIDRYEKLQERLSEIDDLEGDALLQALFPASEEWAAPFRKVAESLEEENYDEYDLWSALHTHVIRPDMPRDVDYVRIMSLYKSKGLTADLVVVAGCVEGAIPSSSDANSPAQRARHEQEQRRLFYVAMTRTTDTLVLSSATRVPRDEAYTMNVDFQTGTREKANTIASQFLHDLGPSKPDAVSGERFLATASGM